MIARRGMLVGLLAAPAIIRTPGLLMPVKRIDWLVWVTLTKAPPFYLDDVYGSITEGQRVLDGYPIVFVAHNGECGVDLETHVPSWGAWHPKG